MKQIPHIFGTYWVDKPPQSLLLLKCISKELFKKLNRIYLPKTCSFQDLVKGNYLLIQEPSGRLSQSTNWISPLFGFILPNRFSKAQTLLTVIIK